MASSTKSASPREVREWARQNGFKVGVKGQFPPEVVEAYNKAHKVKYRVGKFQRTIQVSGVRTNANGRKTPVRRIATPGAIRAAALAAGVELGERGRIPAEVQAAYAAGQYDN